ncbi:hypothetical protein ACYPKM_01315 [Pseudomonas aeruginosa]
MRKVSREERLQWIEDSLRRAHESLDQTVKLIEDRVRWDISQMGAEAVFVEAVFAGHLERAWAVHQLHPDMKIMLSMTRKDYLVVSRGETHEIADSAVSRVLDNSTNARQVLALGFMDAYGMLDGDNQIVTDSVFNYRPPIERLLSQEFTSRVDHRFEAFELPTVQGGMVRSPELMLALEEAALFPAGEIYGELLCWADPATVAAHEGHLLPYSITQRVNLGHKYVGETEIVEYHEVQEYLDMACMEDTAKFLSLVVHLQPIDREPTLDDMKVLNRFASREVYYGFGHPEGMLLCRTSRAFLETLPRTEANHNLVHKLFKRLYDSHFVSVCRMKQDSSYDLSLLGKERHIDKAAIADLATISDIVASDLRDKLPPAAQQLLLHELYVQDGGFARIRKFFPKVRTSRVELQVEELDGLEAEGYRFPDGSWVNLRSSTRDGETDSERDRRVLEALPRLFALAPVLRGVKSTPLFSTMGEVLKSLGECEGSSGFDRSPILKAYIRFHGAEKVLPHAETDEQWDGVMRAFSPRELKPHWSMIPSKYKMAMAASTLSI